MKFYHITEKPLKIYGLAVADAAKRSFWRLPPEMLARMPQYEFLGKRSVGGRVRFSTDSAELTVRMTLAQAKEDVNIPLSGSAGADLYLGRGRQSSFVGYIAPGRHTLEEITVEKTFRKSNRMETVTINLPRNDHLLSMEIGVADGAAVEEAPEYTFSDPIIFYGSSITEGGCASRAGNAYAGIVSRWLDADYRNYGFSGSAHGEPEFAQFIAEHRNPSAFVFDYDHNARDPKELDETHSSFFSTVRRAPPPQPHQNI